MGTFVIVAKVYGLRIAYSSKGYCCMVFANIGITPSTQNRSPCRVAFYDTSEEFWAADQCYAFPVGKGHRDVV